MPDHTAWQSMPPPPGLPEPVLPRDQRSTHALACELLDRVANLERLFERMLEAIEREDDEGEERASTATLDGTLQGGPRDQTVSLG